MVARLMRKDLLLNGSMLAVLVGGLVVMVVIFRFAGQLRGDEMPLAVILVFGSFYGSLLPLMIAARADRFRTRGFDASLPVTRRQILAARYLLPLLLLPAWVGLTYGTCCALSGGLLAPEALRAGTLLLAPTALVVTVGAFFPLVSRVGFMGMLYGLVGLQVVGIALFTVVRSVPWLRSGVTDLFNAIGKIGPSLRGLHVEIGDPWYALLVIATLAGLYGLSFLAGAALERNRDL